MGYKLHVASEYQVKYSSSEAFNNHTAEINRFLKYNCPNIEWDGEDIECAGCLKVPRAELALILAKMITQPMEFSEWLKKHQVSETIGDVVRIIAGWIAQSDQRNDFVVLSWY